MFNRKIKKEDKDQDNLKLWNEDLYNYEQKDTVVEETDQLTTNYKKVKFSAVFLGVLILLVVLYFNVGNRSTLFSNKEGPLFSKDANDAYGVPAEKTYTMREPIDIIGTYEDDKGENIQYIECSVIVKNMEVVMGEKPLLKVDYSVKKSQTDVSFDVSFVTYDGVLEKKELLELSESNSYGIQSAYESHRGDVETLRSRPAGTTVDFTQYYEFSDASEKMALVIGGTLSEDYTGYIDLKPYLEDGTLDLNGVKEKFNTVQKPETIPQGEEALVEGLGVKILSTKSDYTYSVKGKEVYERRTVMVAEIQVTNYTVEPIDATKIGGNFMLADDHSAKEGLGYSQRAVNEELFGVNNQGLIAPNTSKVIRLAFNKFVLEDEGDLNNYLVYNSNYYEFKDLTKFKVDYKFEPRDAVTVYHIETGK